MRWFRQNRVFGAEAALFALVVQFTVAFGHVHADRDGIATAAAANLVIDIQGSLAPANHPGDETCAICATIQLTSAAQVAASPALPLPVTYCIAELSLSSEENFDNPRCIDLRSRGPPQA